ncbi:hypothetical protein GF312_13575 [Candidatus Poribacteria bacterium]|nr:hypothetical protein [Candidatus Poribacteria bacterium]
MLFTLSERSRLKTEDQKKKRRKQIRSIIFSVFIGLFIAWFLLSRIDPMDIPRALGNIPLYSLLLGFMMYALAQYIKAFRLNLVLGKKIKMKQFFPIVSFYLFIVNALPRPAGEVSYVYMLKKQTSTSGPRSFASLVVCGVADAGVLVLGMIVVGIYLREPMMEGLSSFYAGLSQRISSLIISARSNLIFLIIGFILLAALIIFLIWFNRSRTSREHFFWRYLNLAKTKVIETIQELANTPLDIRLLGVVGCSISIVFLRLFTYWYLVKSMKINIGIWPLSFAQFFGSLFSMIPVHGPAGIGTIEAPWVLALQVLGISQQDAITSGFGLHIILIICSTVLGIGSGIYLKFSDQ